jgi:hypothetical protein
VVDAEEIDRLYAQAQEACRVAREIRASLGKAEAEALRSAALEMEARLLREHAEALAAG